LGAGRSCPADYAYSPAAFNRAPDIATDVLYVVGGLYGNLAALDAVERLAAAERTTPTIVFNGDFHWFDAEPSWFEKIESGVAPHLALRGNVETEIARTEDIGAGCGCAYPENVHEDVVQRSNEIIEALRAATSDKARARLARLPMHLVAEVGGLRIGLVHGDAASLAGWRFAREALDDGRNRPWLSGVRHNSQIDLFASTHTCLAVLRDMALPAGRLTIVNNGAAGMPNFSCSTFGVVSRIAVCPSPHRTLYGLTRDAVRIDAIALHYDQRAFVERFLARWQARSPAHVSYYDRITAGPDYPMAQALA
jgi:hypothetical protein